MSKIKNVSFVIAIFVAILITFFITKYFDSINKCSIIKDKFPKNSPKVTEVQRLPTNIIPFNYDLRIQPFMGPDLFYFNGSVQISINCIETTNVIQMNANELEILNENIIIKNQIANKEEQLKPSNVKLKDQVLTIKLDKNLNKNENYSIFIPFKGNLTTSLNGFYRSSYVESQTKQIKYLSMTHFEPTYARNSFPCFDEPSFKATFDIEITHLKNMTAVSNMPNVSSTEIDEDWIRTKFNRSIKMSTYLVAYAIGEFAFTEINDIVPKQRIITRPSEKEKAKKAIEFGPKILAYFEEYFGIKYPLSKLDMLAAPDFGAGAMENFGLITYREYGLLYDEKFESAVKLFYTCSIIAHELSHQWFGNLVTMSWWNGLWLNEGFATYMKYQGVNEIKPEWAVFEQFVVDEIQNVLSLDLSGNTHPISVKVSDPNEIGSLFDRISYGKGAAIISMISYILGERAFREGLYIYLNTFKYSNAEQDDLWKCLQEAYDKYNPIRTNKIDVKKIMDSWTLEKGYPLITITRDYTTDEVRFSQQRFLLNSSNRDELIKTQYEVPITFTTQTMADWKPTIKFWLHKAENQSESYMIKKLNLSNDEWIIANVQETNFYRVNYDDKNWEILIEKLLKNHTEIHRINRAQILDDLFHLAQSGLVNYSLPLKAIQYLKREDESLPWTIVNRLADFISKMLSNSEQFELWQFFINDQVKSAYRKMNLTTPIDAEDFQTAKMQKSIVELACNHDLDECVKDSEELFNKFIEMNSPIPQNVRQTVYCTAIAKGTAGREWNFIYGRYLNESNANERNVMLRALTCSRVPWILKRLLKWTIDENSSIRQQDAGFIFQGIATQNYGKDIAFNFLREDWNDIYRIYSKSKSLTDLIDSFRSINTPLELSSMIELNRSVGYRVGRSKRAFKQTIEQIEWNILWFEKYRTEIGEFLKDYQSEHYKN